MSAEMDRRAFLKGGAGLVFALRAAGTLAIVPFGAAEARGRASPWPAARDIAPAELDTWLSVAEDGAVTAFFGKPDMGQGVDSAIAQVVAEELAVDVGRIAVVMGDTGRTANQGGTSGSSGCRLGAGPLRNAAAAARQVFLARASERLGVPKEELTAADGRVRVTGAPQRSLTYGQMIADGFDTSLDWNGRYGNGLTVATKAALEDPKDYRVVGTPVARADIPGKVLATTEFCHHVSLPGMLHGRCVRPPVANAVPAAVDARSIAGIPGARVVRKKDFLGVVAEREWHAIEAARQLKVRWTETQPPFPSMDALYEHIRGAPVVADNSVANFGGHRDYDPKPSLEAIAASAAALEAEYELPFQSHARMAPSVGVAHVKDGEALIFSDTQKPHYTRDGIAKILGLPAEKVRVIWKPGPGSYGRSDADEAAFEAAVMSQAVGRPVRVQWMRHEGHGWDPKAPAAVITCKAGLDADGDVEAWYFRAKGFSGWDVLYNAADPKDTLIGELLGYKKGDAQNFGVPGESYAFPRAVKFWETVPPLLDRASPLRTAHMRAPQEPQIHFAHESFIDEVAAHAHVDPIELRLKYLTDAREIEVLKAAARLAGWQSRPSPAPKQTGKTLRGRGVSLNSGFGSYVATVCEVEVERATGRIWARRFHVAHDCGLVINPRSLRGTIEGNIVQGLSRTLFEEVRFDRDNVRSIDWNTYPIVEIGDAPERIDIKLLDRPQTPAGGAGEPAHVTVPAAVANAVFDATGVRLRRLPLTPQRLKAQLA
jgi:CO/xanthine dehydrogenase Mo-binding subunit